MQALGFLGSLQGETFGGQPTGRDQANALAQLVLEALPRFLIESFSSANSIVQEARFAGVEVFLKKEAQAIIFGAMSFDPIAHDLGVAQGTQASEQLSGNVAQLAPERIGVDFRQNGSDGAAAADSDAQVVNGVLVRRAAEIIEFREDATNPMVQSPMLMMSTGKGGNASHAMPQAIRRCRMGRGPCPAEQIG